MNKFFDLAFLYLLKDEGSEFVNDPLDSGGPTKYGITQKTLEHHLNRLTTIQEVKDLTIEVAKKIYLDNYWRPVGGNRITHLETAVCLFNSAVLYGVKTTSRLAQQALNNLGKNLKTDGFIGEKSIEALNSVNTSEFIKAFHEQLLVRIDIIIEADSKNERFRNGWTNRANRLLTLGSEIAVLTKIS